jgi:hypothetical protein
VPKKGVYEKNGWSAWGEYHMIPGYTWYLIQLLKIQIYKVLKKLKIICVCSQDVVTISKIFRTKFETHTETKKDKIICE